MNLLRRWRAQRAATLAARTEHATRTKGPVMAAPAAVWRPAKPEETPGQRTPQLAAPRPAPSLVPPAIATQDPHRCPGCGAWLAFGMAHYCTGLGADVHPQRRIA